MKNNFLIEIGIGVALAVLVAILTYAHATWMPNMTTILTLMLIVGTFGAFTIYAWREGRGDEREQLIRFVASRAAFLATGSILLLGIIVETLIHHAPNPWLGLALVVMVGAKIIGHAYGVISIKRMFVQRGLSTGVVVAIVGLLILLGGGFWVMSSSKDSKDAMMMKDDAMVSDEKMEGDKAMMMEDSHMEGDSMKMEKDGEAMEAPSGDAMMEKKDEGAMMDHSSVEGATPLALTGTKLAGNTSPLLIFNEADYNAALASSNTVLLWYYAEWCPTCKLEQKDIVAAFNEFDKPGVVGFRVNISDNDTSEAEEQTARDYGVAFRHTKVAIKGGERVLKTTEVWKKEHYLEQLNNFVN